MIFSGQGGLVISLVNPQFYKQEILGLWMSKFQLEIVAQLFYI